MNNSRLIIEEQQKWRDEIDNIPYLSFPPEWQIQIIPPFADAVIRFIVKYPDGNTRSVYLDSRGSLGYFGFDKNNKPIPYWEVYPVNEENVRCHKDDVEKLMEILRS